MWLPTYSVDMAWLWWLLAPLVASVVGAIALWLRGLRQQRSMRWQPGSAMADHHALLVALGQNEAKLRTAAGTGEPGEPVNIRVLSTASENAGIISG